MCFVDSGFRKFAYLNKVNSSKMAMHCMDKVAIFRTAILAYNFRWLL